MSRGGLLFYGDLNGFGIPELELLWPLRRWAPEDGEAPLHQGLRMSWHLDLASFSAAWAHKTQSGRTRSCGW